MFIDIVDGLNYDADGLFLLQYGEKLQSLYTSVDEMEQLLKQISKHLQILVSDLSAEEVAAMSSALKREKVRFQSFILNYSTRWSYYNGN